ncbi:hypothetical protein [Deinococcus soli (ex Cha et al. 2016)]|uniref:hypothetical protein n=1 Tax=Deinococcus soli (ex Cha et al. 2016) TaxID=1309411 RepID=UPI0016664ECD|nr:hypothetical protein [Deinococcus soli (ex Cha et al. 2016)]GGB73612.1 hypothetical protein GCM10008019_32270 [Deinococcus soli (ex Cha et al. 2016)]
MGAYDINWSANLPAGYAATYAFDGAAAQTYIQSAWVNRVSQRGALGVGVTTTLTITYTSSAGKARGDAQTGAVSASVSTGACSVTDTQTLTTIRAAGAISKYQAACTVNPDGTITCGQSTADPVNVQPCTVLRYDLVALNNGDAPLVQASIREPLSSDLRFLSVNAANLGGRPVLYSSDGVVWSATPPAPGTAQLYAALDSNGDGAITKADTLPPGGSLVATVYARVNGVGCAPVSLPVSEVNP